MIGVKDNMSPLSGKLMPDGAHIITRALAYLVGVQDNMAAVTVADNTDNKPDGEMRFMTSHTPT